MDMICLFRMYMRHFQTYIKIRLLFCDRTLPPGGHDFHSVECTLPENASTRVLVSWQICFFEKDF